MNRPRANLRSSNSTGPSTSAQRPIKRLCRRCEGAAMSLAGDKPRFRLPRYAARETRELSVRSRDSRPSPR